METCLPCQSRMRRGGLPGN